MKRKPPSSQRRARLERRHVNVHGHLRLLAGEAPLAVLSWCCHGDLGPLHSVCRGVLAQVRLRQLALPPRHHADRKKIKQNKT